MKPFVWLIFMIFGLVTVGFCQDFSDPKLGKRRPQGYMQPDPKQIEMETAKRIFNVPMRDPFKEPRKVKDGR